jgi:flagellar protein FlaG
MVTAVTPVAIIEATPPRSQVVSPPPAPERPPEPSLRLVIEEAPSSGQFVYKTLDRSTGEVVRQFPREEMLRMRSDAGYAAGDVIATDA